MSDLVGNPEDRFSHNEAHIIFYLLVLQHIIHNPLIIAIVSYAVLRSNTTPARCIKAISIIFVGLNPEALKKTTYECLGPKSDYEKNRKNAVQKKPGQLHMWLIL